MATSGTATFNLEISEVVEEAFERCGLQSKTGYDMDTARRSLNLLFLDRDSAYRSTPRSQTS